MANVFVSGPVLPERALVYVKRPQEEKLFRELEAGRSCALIGPPRLGKTSLAIKATRRFREPGRRAAYLNLIELGREGSTAAWLERLCDRLAEELELPPTNRDAGAPLDFRARWSAFLRDEVLARGERVLLVLDETNMLHGRSFAADFFSVLASIQQTEGRLAFCLISTVALGELVEAGSGNPFSAATVIELLDFTEKEIAPWSEHLGVPDPQAWLDAIYAQTEGHPYLTQRMCGAVASGEMPAGEGIEERVQTFVGQLIGERTRLDPIFDIAERIFAGVRSPVVKLDALDIYEQLLAGERVRVEDAPSAAVALRLAGLTSEQHHRGKTLLKLRNRVFAGYFDEEWVERQRRALHRPYTADIERWVASGRRADHLPRGSALSEAVNWFAQRAELTLSERDYYTTLLRKLTTTQRAQSVVLAVLVAAVLAATGLLSYELRSANEETRRLAELNKRFDPKSFGADQSDLTARVERAQKANAAIQQEYQNFKGSPSGDYARALLDSAVASEDDLAKVLAAVDEGRLQRTSELLVVTGERDEARAALARMTGERDDLKARLNQGGNDRDRKYAQLISELQDQNSRLAQLSAAREQDRKEIAVLMAERDALMKRLLAVEPRDGGATGPLDHQH